MEQNSERDYLGRQYASGSSEPGPVNQYESPSFPDDGGAGADTAGTSTGTGTEERAPAAVDVSIGAAAPQQLQIGTVVWGLVLTTLAVLMLLTSTVNLSVDPVLVILGVTLGAGFALLAGGFISAAVKNRRR